MQCLKAQDFDVYETYVNGQSTPANKLYRKLGIGGKLAELLAIPAVAQYFEVMSLRLSMTKPDLE